MSKDAVITDDNEQELTNEIIESSGQLCLGTLVLQDAASVLGIAVLEGLAPGDPDDTSSSPLYITVLVLLGKLLVTILIFVFLERYVLQKMFNAFARSLELLYLGSLGYATGMAAIAVTCGFSGEITAFLAGVSIAQLPYKMHIETKMEPIKSLGVAIFFLSLGLQLEVNQKMVEALPIGFGLAIFTLFATLPLFMGLGYLAKLKAHTVYMLGLLMNQISEFSLILCTLCVRAEVLEPIVLTVVTIAAVVSIVVSSIGHTFCDDIYQKIQRRPCLLCIDAHYRKGFAQQQQQNNKESESQNDADQFVEEPTDLEISLSADAAGNNKKHPPLLLRKCPSNGVTEVEEWAFEDQLIHRSTENLEIDLKDTEKELETARELMAATADEKHLHPGKTKKPLQLYGDGSRKGLSGKNLIIKTSHATDIMHGMIEGYVIIDDQLMFCTVRAGRMLFWGDQLDVGYVPPTSVWDISGMTILQVETEEDTRAIVAARKNDSNLTGNNNNNNDDDDEEEEVHPWEWTIVLGHIRRHTGTSSIEDVAMKLTIHGLENQSDHDAQDWQDALTVATAVLNSIALRLAHIREELHSRRSNTTPFTASMHSMQSFDSRIDAHNHRNKIICIGYNEMFPAVLALADAIHKDVVVVEYDPMKINTVQKLYNEETRRQDFKGKKSIKVLLKETKRAFTTDEIPKDGDVEQGISSRRSRRLKSLSMPVHQTSRAKQSFFGLPSDLISIQESVHEEEQIKGVTCEYADIHDPECWEELEMDQAFMLVVTMKGARHAEKAIIKWLRKHGSDTIFIAFTQNNVEAIQLYQAGAHYVMQSDALAMRSTRDIFMETVANVGDCSQLVAAGLAHKKRLVKLESENHLKFRYETG